MNAILQVENLTKQYADFKLDHVSFSVPKGTIMGLIGENGAGKSTTINAILDLIHKDDGTVTFWGQELSSTKQIKEDVGVVFDGINFYETLTPAKVGKIAGAAYKQWDGHLFQDYLKRFQLPADKEIKSLSKGMKMKLCIAVALSHKPKLLILDEATSGLDPVMRYEKLREVFELDEKRPIRRFSKGMQKQAAFWLALSAMPDYLILDEPVDGLDPVMRRQVWSLMMGDVAERGTTVLVSSHNLRELEDVCDHVGIMDHGHVLLERSLAQLQDNMVKLQVVFPDGMEDVPAELPVLHASKLGRVHTLIMRMNAQEATERLMAYSPLLVDAIPLTLEEIFIYELGGADYAVKDIVL